MKDSINYWAEKIKPYTRLVSIVIFAFILLGFWQFEVEKSHKSPISIVTTKQNDSSATGGQTVTTSKTGTKYYFSGCSGVARIKPENRVTFASPALAQAAGYTAAVGCR